MSKASDRNLSIELRAAFEGNELGVGDEIIDLWNEFAAAYDKPQIYHMGDLEYQMMDIAEYPLLNIIAMLDTRFDVRHAYWYREERNGTLVSFEDLLDRRSPFNINQLIYGIVQDKDSFGSYQVQKLLDEFGE